MTTKTRAISYHTKDKNRCKICEYEFYREQLHSGGGRLIAGKLTAELRRTYDKSKKYGLIYPMAYSILTCPQCLYSSFQNDFDLLSPDEIQKLQQQTRERQSGIEKIVGPIDFTEDRNLILGAASYILAIACYQNRETHAAPTPKKAISSLRAAWLFGDMNEEFAGMGFDKQSRFLYLKAVQYYGPVLEIMSSGKEPHEQFQHLLGPDTDQNWGFDGVIYLNGYFTLKYVEELASTTEKKIELLTKSKRFLGKLYGMGRSSKSKPSLIVDMSKDLYENIATHLEKLSGS